MLQGNICVFWKESGVCGREVRVVRKEGELGVMGGPSCYFFQEWGKFMGFEIEQL